ncbi:SprT family protein [Pseudalkalibacillus berkeleyi]|uniref:Protein SprT-like n=1 Tax=Pseudalkalibacillus berkeleyi TaxID=1069813 RepID=A0ABS9H608_9BACL|nr:SprT family protein [Pseudalkalibacillus berkeleyi]MCF6139341.1 SprT family protein [Pseudalkalibacillus berkeleyi]
MEQSELQQLVEEISLQSFNRSFTHNARFNQRLKTTGGRYLLKSHDLEFNPKQLEVHGIEEFKKIIKHELCHYHLHILNRGYRHRDQDFKQLLEAVGGSRYCQIIPGQRRQESIKYLYRCKACGIEYRRKRRVDTNKYACGKCSGKLILK